MNAGTQTLPHGLSVDNITRRSVDNDDEVDDIELILSSDDKEYTQEDLVSISYYEPWQLCGQTGTPVLVNFNSIPPDNNENMGDESRGKLSPSSVNHDQFYNAIKDNAAQQQLSLESSDSLCLGDNKRQGYGFNSKSMSLEKDAEARTNDEDGLVRDESFDTFQPSGYKSTTGRRWTNYNVFQETDISKIGAIEEDVPDKGRRNTCPNAGPYRPIIHREILNNNNSSGGSMGRCPLAVKFARSARTHLSSINNRTNAMDSHDTGPKRNSSVQTEISLSTLPEHWRSESHLMAGLGNCFFTLPSKFIPTIGVNVCKHPLKISEKTREARRVLLSDINFTSMVPELSRSADHLCHGEEQQNLDNNNEDDSAEYSKGPFLKTPDYINRGITPSMSLTSPGVSQWTVNESSFGAQTIQTDNNWSVQHGDSFDSYKSNSNGSKLSFGKHNRSRSCPSIRCALCKHRHHGGIKMSESMNYTPRVTFQEVRPNSVLGSLPDLRPECACGCPWSRTSARKTTYRHGDSCGSTESILDEAEDILRESIDGTLLHETNAIHSNEFLIKETTRRCSENDINKKDFSPSKQTLPFLPKSTKCLKPGHLAKVIAKNGRVVMGRVRYVGPLVSNSQAAGIDGEMETYVGIQLPNKTGDCNGSFEGRKFFDCEPHHGIFVPFKKIVMAWTS